MKAYKALSTGEIHGSSVFIDEDEVRYLIDTQDCEPGEEIILYNPGDWNTWHAWVIVEGVIRYPLDFTGYQ